MVGETILKEGREALDPCFSDTLLEREELTQRQALVCAVSLLGLSVLGIFGGIALLRSAMATFDAAGGTISPEDPPQTLVVSGPYGYVRNPLALAQLLILLCEGTLVGLPKILGLAGAYAVFLLVYTPCSEEPDLRSRFGADWVHYKYAVGAWWPRCSPWKPGEYEQV